MEQNTSSRLETVTTLVNGKVQFSGTAIRVLLQKMNRTVNGITIQASGIRQEKPPYSFSGITLNFTITTPDAGREDMDKALQLAEASLCPVWSLVKGNVEITVAYDLITQ